MSNIRNKKRGFTLIELMVVISIISLLASIVILSLTEAKNRAKEAKVKSEIQAIKLVLDQYNLNNGGYPNPTGSTDNVYCIGSNDCLVMGNPVTTQFPAIEETVAKTLSNLAAAIQIFPSFDQNVTLIDGDGNENRGYVYVACGGGTPTCVENTATLVAPAIDTISFIHVGSFEAATCEFAQCQEDYGMNCGNGTEDCSNYSTTEGACNYDIKGSGSSNGMCDCGTYNNEPCSNYCNSTSQNYGCAYDADGTNSCTCGSCTGTPNCGGDYSTCGNVYGCSWGGGTSDSCSGTPTCGGDSSTCGNVYGCSWGGGTSDSCRGTPTCGGDSNTCGNVYGCSWSAGSSAYCGGSPTTYCYATDEYSCGAPNCIWNGYSCNSAGCDGGNESSCTSVSGCTWYPEVSPSCSGSPMDSCSGDSTSCGQRSGCSWSGYTPDYCGGTPSDSCSGDASSCGQKSGCSWGGATSDYCSGTASDSCGGDYSSCGQKSGCSWSQNP